MDNFANIGKAIIIQSLGIQKNYTEVIESTIDTIDYNNTACAACKYRAIINTFDKNSKAYADSCAACENCPNKALTQKNVYRKVYHNEKNRYGYRPMLKGNAIKLLWLLHFYHPDNNGILYDIDANELAHTLGCNVRTVWNNLLVLQEYTYISYSRTSYGLLNIVLNDYENYYLPANKGGRGFLVVSKELMQKLISVKSLVSLRICIRELVNLDAPELKGQASVDYKHIRDIRSVLPPYCKPSIIKSRLAECPDIFTVMVNNDMVRFEINPNFVPKIQKASAHDEYIGELQKFIWNFNQNVAYINAGGESPDELRIFFDKIYPNASYKLMYLNDIEVDDLASLALHYSYNIVINALSVVYREYFMYEKQINNLAGLVSTIIRSQFNNSKKAA